MRSDAGDGILSGLMSETAKYNLALRWLSGSLANMRNMLNVLLCFFFAFAFAVGAQADSYKFVPIPVGTYEIGDVTGDNNITGNPVRSVTLSPYSMAVNDTTKAQWDVVRTWALAHGYTNLAAGAGKASNHPVHMVSWYDVVKWANAASEKDGLKPCYSVNGSVFRTGKGNIIAVTCDWSANGYRLPTEAEWEVAARGGLTGKRFPFGDTISQSQGNYWANSSYSYDLSGEVNGTHPNYATGSLPLTSPVGSFAANGYGLNDMAGNVWQWCWDLYAETTVAGSNPRGVSAGSNRSLRGGDWSGNANYARSAQRCYNDPALAYLNGGFRLARGRH